MQHIVYDELQSALKEIERLRRSNEELERFTAVVSHDLREPLRMVSAYAQLLAQRYQGRFDADADEFLEFVASGAEWMTQLVSDLLEYSKAGNERKRLVSVDSQRSLDSALRNLRVSIEDSGAIIISERLPQVLANDQLTRVFQNLIGNAIKHRAQASPGILVSAQPDGEGHWRFSVADNGIGLDMSHADRLFKPFYRVRGKEECAGTGMGLAICQQIIDQLGGRIWVHSEPGKGSTFFFSVRAAPETVAAVEQRSGYSTACSDSSSS
ncbi:MAG: ATP-binding protein [Acidobacteriota bacterium]|nr:ATP-binding protein [Acidobacteriota bacterium]